MNAQQMWELYCEHTGCTGDCDAWAFGAAPDELAQLVLMGVKTATSSAHPLYSVDGEALPRPGEFSVILDGKGQAVCVIQTRKVTVVPFDRVEEDHAWKEGEGDRSLSYWRSVRMSLFTQWMEDAGLVFTPDMPVVCEEFVRVFP